MLGNYDIVNIVEAPTNEVITRISVELGSRGTIQLITPEMNIDVFVQMIRENSSL